MTPFQQSPHMLNGRHAVRFGDGIALLDVSGDSYSCLYDPAHGQAARSLPDTRSTAASDGAPSEAHPICRPWRSLSAADPHVRLRDIHHFVSSLFVAAIRFRRRDFAGLLAAEIRPRSARATAPTSDLAVLVARFERMSLFLPIAMLCLFRSFFLLHFLARYGKTADWTFGVTLFPFRAHCWLARDDLLIGETADRAAQFSPILIVKAGRR